MNEWRAYESKPRRTRPRALFLVTDDLYCFVNELRESGDSASSFVEMGKKPSENVTQIGGVRERLSRCTSGDPARSFARETARTWISTGYPGIPVTCPQDWT